MAISKEVMETSNLVRLEAASYQRKLKDEVAFQPDAVLQGMAHCRDVFNGTGAFRHFFEEAAAERLDAYLDGGKPPLPEDGKCVGQLFIIPGRPYLGKKSGVMFVGRRHLKEIPAPPPSPPAYSPPGTSTSPGSNSTEYCW